MERREVKYIILQQDEVEKYLTDEQKIKLDEITATLYMGRREDKKPINNYVVVNMREPYAEPFWNIIVAFEEAKKGAEAKAVGKEEQCQKER